MKTRKLNNQKKFRKLIRIQKLKPIELIKIKGGEGIPDDKEII